jgi:hypothetical protein
MLKNSGQWSVNNEQSDKNPWYYLSLITHHYSLTTDL